ncbi:Vhs2p KNAG_0E01710 [Huiozyma naganishii CBS 8797]|uniref:Uncharacterized protein n=1 Tax=Huiozyma naganishii (strain ATCC MYA-139 / BCRC 22969 / CBS 8797 / KCTC 17520 / NBRC 10181 / NCYC 3082 / Yp74L-3) TaxID=1071383 RepID=J7RLM3_HUIN7|nr:hypothetical protein KNAG_0E01710 [Kazachstania naganishii CBS 8797]CCK70433.1 hypothetical protein KNAG_0E01710 [Kazachstania naganishii CBS 8797]
MDITDTVLSYPSPRLPIPGVQPTGHQVVTATVPVFILDVSVWGLPTRPQFSVFRDSLEIERASEDDGGTALGLRSLGCWYTVERGCTTVMTLRETVSSIADGVAGLAGLEGQGGRDTPGKGEQRGDGGGAWSPGRDDDDAPGEQFFTSPSSAASLSSLIFERNVEDPYGSVSALGQQQQLPQPTLSRNGSMLNLSRRASHNNLPARKYSSGGAGGAAQFSSHTSLSNFNYAVPLGALQRTATGASSNASEYTHPQLERHHTLENFVPPALDEGCSLVADRDTNLEDVNMVYSKRPSTLGLDMALGRTRSYSGITANGRSSPSLARSYSNTNDLGVARATTRQFRPVSYADLLYNENNNQSPGASPPTEPRPALLPHFSYCSGSPSPPTSSTHDTKFHNPFVTRRYSSNGGNNGVPTLTRDDRLRRPLTCGTPPTPAQVRTARNGRRPLKFHLESSGSEELSTDEEVDPNAEAVVDAQQQVQDIGTSLHAPGVHNSKLSNSNSTIIALNSERNKVPDQ